MFGFWPWPVDYVLDEDDLPRLAEPERFDLLRQPPKRRVWSQMVPTAQPWTPPGRREEAE